MSELGSPPDRYLTAADRDDVSWVMGFVVPMIKNVAHTGNGMLFYGEHSSLLFIETVTTPQVAGALRTKIIYRQCSAFSDRKFLAQVRKTFFIILPLAVLGNSAGTPSRPKNQTQLGAFYIPGILPSINHLRS